MVLWLQHPYAQRIDAASKERAHVGSDTRQSQRRSWYCRRREREVWAGVVVVVVMIMWCACKVQVCVVCGGGGQLAEFT